MPTDRSRSCRSSSPKARHDRAHRAERGPRGNAKGRYRPMSDATGPWADYLAAAQRLDAVRRAATSAASEQAATVQAAQQELAAVRARLAPQRARLVQDLGVPESDLLPLETDLMAATQAVADGPAAALAAPHPARANADATYR